MEIQSNGDDIQLYASGGDTTNGYLSRYLDFHFVSDSVLRTCTTVSDDARKETENKQEVYDGPAGVISNVGLLLFCSGMTVCSWLFHKRYGHCVVDGATIKEFI